MLSRGIIMVKRILYLQRAACVHGNSFKIPETCILSVAVVNTFVSLCVRYRWGQGETKESVSAAQVIPWEKANSSAYRLASTGKDVDCNQPNIFSLPNT